MRSYKDTKLLWPYWKTLYIVVIENNYVGEISKEIFPRPEKKNTSRGWIFPIVSAGIVWILRYSLSSMIGSSVFEIWPLHEFNKSTLLSLVDGRNTIWNHIFTRANVNLPETLKTGDICDILNFIILTTNLYPATLKTP